MSKLDPDEEERTKRGAYWSRFAMTLLSLKASLSSQVDGDLDASGSGDTKSPRVPDARPDGDRSYEGEVDGSADSVD